MLGVADGVGGYNEQGICPGEYAKALMREAAKVAETAGPRFFLHPRDVLQAAWGELRSPLGLEAPPLSLANHARSPLAALSSSRRPPARQRA